MSEEKKPTEVVEAAKPAETKKAEAAKDAPAETPKTEAPKAEAPKEKKPMDPKKKKNIIIWSCVGAGVVIAAVVTVILVIVLTKVDYKESYDVALELDDKIKDFYYDYDDCSDVIEDVEYKYSGESSYSSYVSDCKEAVKPETTELVKKLGGTSGVARDGDVKAKFDKFNEEYSKAISGVDDETAKKLDVYDNWHKFYYNGISNGFYSSTTEEDVKTAADYAINTGIDALKTFAEQWKEKALEVVKARKAYDDATTGYSSLYSTYTSKRSELSTWVEKNIPKIQDVLPLSFNGDASAVRSAWKEFTEVLGEKYKDKAVEDAANEIKGYEDLLKELMK